MYCINPKEFSGVFAVPAAVVDRHIKLAGSAQLKALLWIYRHSCEPIDIEKLSKAIGISVADVKDALQYWLECGLLIEEDEAKSMAEKAESKPEPKEDPQPTEPAAKATDNPPKEKSTEKVLPELPVLKPTQEQIAQRVDASTEVRELLNEAQQILGRTIGYSAQAALLMLFDHYALPIPVILMICEYARSTGRQGNINYIQTMGKNWAERGIDTFDKAVEQLVALENTDKLWKEFASFAGITSPRPTTTQQKYLDTWHNKWKFSLEMICIAYEKAAERTGQLNMNYMNGILKNWNENGISTVEDIEKYDKAPKVTSIKDAKKPLTTSYDIEQAEREAFEPPIYRKRGAK